MKYLVLTYDPIAISEPIVQAFDDDAEAFRVLEAETLENLGRHGVEVVLFYSESEAAFRSANHRYFNPEVSQRLLENLGDLHRGVEKFQHSLAGLTPSLSS